MTINQAAEEIAYCIARGIVGPPESYDSFEEARNELSRIKLELVRDLKPTLVKLYQAGVAAGAA